MNTACGKKWLRRSLCLICVLLLQAGCGNARHTIKIKTFIDGVDTIKIQGSKIWYEHEEWSLPGKYEHHDEFTFINGERWHPTWDGNVSLPYENLSPSFQPHSLQDIKLIKLLGRGEVRISHLPTPENNETLSIKFRDDPPGADWYEVAIQWK
jgi:hypothetical protein